MTPWQWAKGGVILVVLLATAFLIRTMFRPTKLDVETAHSQTVLDSTPFYRDSISRMAQREAVLMHRAAQLQHDAAMGSAQLRSLATQLERASTAKDTIKALDSMVVAQRWLLFTAEARCSALDSAYVSCGERAALLQVRLDTVTAALGRQVSVSQCRVLFVHCPTRLQTAGIFLLVGTVGGYVVARP